MSNHSGMNCVTLTLTKQLISFPKSQPWKSSSFTKRWKLAKELAGSKEHLFIPRCLLSEGQGVHTELSGGTITEEIRWNVSCLDVETPQITLSVHAVPSVLLAQNRCPSNYLMPV